MEGGVERVAQVLRTAAETHHAVYQFVDGADDDWASWYADWLLNLSPLAELLGTTPVRSELVWLLVGLDKRYSSDRPDEPWDAYYAARVVAHFNPDA